MDRDKRLEGNRRAGVTDKEEQTGKSGRQTGTELEQKNNKSK